MVVLPYQFLNISDLKAQSCKLEKISETLKEMSKIIHFHNSASISYVNLFPTTKPLTKLVQSEI